MNSVSQTADFPESPFAKYKGTINLGGQDVECYVLDTEERVISMRGSVKAIEGTDGGSGNLSHYTRAKALQPYVNANVVGESIEFVIPGIPGKAKGIRAEQFMSLCQGFVQAISENVELTKKQYQAAVRCAVLLSACAKTGLIALIDEATGFQYERDQNALQVKIQAFIAEELRDWEKTFSDELWEQFGRLTNWSGPLHSRPKYWGKLVLELIYDALDPDVSQYLQENKPKPSHGQNYHQWLTDHAVSKLQRHIEQIIGIAKSSSDLQELRRRVAYIYKKEPMQLSLFNDFHPEEKKDNPERKE